MDEGKVVSFSLGSLLLHSNRSFPGVHFLQVSADTAAGSGSGSAGAAAGGRRLKQAGTPGTATPTKAAATVRTLPAFS